MSHTYQFSLYATQKVKPFNVNVNHYWNQQQRYSDKLTHVVANGCCFKCTYSADTLQTQQVLTIINSKDVFIVSNALNYTEYYKKLSFRYICQAIIKIDRKGPEASTID
jgi:hypothetical protein